MAAFAALLAAAAHADSQPVLGMASSDYPFFAAGSEIGGTTTMFDGETLSSGYLPAWLDYQDGARYALGVGSQASVFVDRVELDGVSLEIVSAGSRLRRVVAGGLQFVPKDPTTQATIYSDRPEVVSVFVAEGELEVLLVDGSRGALIKKNQFATFSRTMTSPRVQEQRAPLEIARILLRQLDFVSALEKPLPALRKERLRLSGYLTRASGGLIGGSRALSIPGSEAVPLEGSPVVDAELLLGAAVAVGTELHRSVAWDRYGCGSPDCASPIPPRTPYRFDGYAAAAPPLDSGCALCRGTDSPLR